MGSGRVLVTGGSGFLGAHCIVQLLAAGYRVRTTVRSLTREGDVRAMLKTAGSDAGDALSFAAADLTTDEGWPEAVAGCDHVLHVASPFPAGVPKHEDELIVPARDGALRVLRAAREAGVKRVVLTSSFAAIGYGHPDRSRPFTEESWTDVSQPMSAYAKSKTLAERAAWDFVAKEGGPELAVVNPSASSGRCSVPTSRRRSCSCSACWTAPCPAVPRLSFGIVDVRDVADLHLRAMTDPAAPGRALPRDRRRLHDVPRDRPRPEGAPRRGRAARADAGAAQLARAARRASSTPRSAR